MNARPVERIVYLGTIVLIGCASARPSFHLNFPDNRPGDAEQVLAAIAQHPTPTAAPLAIGLTDEPHQLYAFRLDEGQELWSQPVRDPQTGPLLAGELVYIAEGTHMVARRIRDGRRVFDVALDHRHLVGAAGDGSLSAFVISTTGGVGAHSLVGIASGGTIVHRLAVDAAVGSPAVHGGMVFVPWANQNLSVVDGITGDETYRFRLADSMLGHVVTNDSGVFFGQRGIGQLGPGIESGLTQDLGWYEPPEVELPGSARLWHDAYGIPPGPDSAHHRVRLDFSPSPAASPDTPLRFESDALYLTYYRIVFGLAPATFQPRMAFQAPADIVGVQPGPNGVMLADANGAFYALSAEGQLRWQTQAEDRHPTVVAFETVGFAPTGDEIEPSAAVPDQLLTVAQSSDARLVPARAFAARALGAISDEAVTEHLIALCDDRSAPAPLHAAACDSLASRSDGNEAVLAALARHAAFLDGTTSPPAGALARLAANLNESRAVPHLIAHLRDPATESADLTHIADALATLGEESAMAPLRDFLRLYHADDDAALAPALGAVARALVALGGPAGRDDVRQVLELPFTADAARGPIASALETEADEEAGEEVNDTESDESAAESE